MLSGGSGTVLTFLWDFAAGFWITSLDNVSGVEFSSWGGFVGPAGAAVVALRVFARDLADFLLGGIVKMSW